MYRCFGDSHGQSTTVPASSSTMSDRPVHSGGDGGGGDQLAVVAIAAAAAAAAKMAIRVMLMADGRGVGSRKDVSHVLKVESGLAQILF